MVCRPFRALFLVTLLAGPSQAVASAHDGQRAREYFSQGMDAMQQGRLDVARSAFEAAASLAPEWGLAYLHWGLAIQSVEPDSQEALGALKKAGALDPENAGAHFYLGVLLERLARLDDAGRELKRALELRPTMKKAWVSLGNVLQAGGDKDGAIGAFREVLKLDPQELAAWVSLAQLYETKGEIESAEGAWLSLTRLQPEVAYHYYRLGQFYERTGERRKAKRAYTRAEQLDPRPQRRMRKLR